MITLIFLIIVGLCASIVAYLHVLGSRDNEIIIWAWVVVGLVYACNLILKIVHLRG